MAHPALARRNCAGDADGGSDPGTLDKVSDGVVAAAAGFDHGLVVRQGGKLLQFGSGVKAPAGAGPGLHLATVVLKVPVVAVAAGEERETGWSAWCVAWWPAVHESPLLRPALQLQPHATLAHAGEHHSLALAENGSVWAFGSNREGQVGDASVAGEAPAPVLVLGPGSHHREAGMLQPAVAVAAGARHSVVVNALGQCLAWGWSLYGEWLAFVWSGCVERVGK